MSRRLLVFLLILSLLPGCQGSGDRVLVSKFNYDTHTVPPDRYDVVVFKYPAMPMENGTPKNYIKRLLGLPGELIALFFGRIYAFTPPSDGRVPDGITAAEWRDLLDTSHADPLDLWKGPDPLGHQDEIKLPNGQSYKPPRNYLHPTAQKLWDQGKFEIARKPPAVMLALSRIVFDNDHQPADLKSVVPDRWAPQSVTDWVPDNSGFKTPGTMKSQEWLRYRNIRRPAGWPGANDIERDRTIKEIQNRKHWPHLITDTLGYNSYEIPGHHGASATNWVGDLMVSCKLTVDEPRGEFWMELGKGMDRFQARFDLATGKCSLYRWTKKPQENGAAKPAPDWQFLAAADTKVKAKGDYNLRFANYDDRLTVWVGRDLPFGEGKTYPAPTPAGPDSADDREARLAGNLDAITNNDLQPAGLCSVGAAVQVHHIQLRRDTYYTGFTKGRMLTSDHDSAIIGDDWGHPEQWGSLRNLQAKTIYVYPGHYLCLGDNSQESSDSRVWGLVPDRLMLGRALMVYFPFERAGVIR